MAYEHDIICTSCQTLIGNTEHVEFTKEYTNDFMEFVHKHHVESCELICPVCSTAIKVIKDLYVGEFFSKWGR